MIPSVDMNSILIIVSSVIFYVLGRFAGHEQEAKKTIERKIQERKKEKVKPGVIEYSTPQQEEYSGSEQERIDQEWKKNAESAGLT